ncbi:MAG: hypothetical protein AAF572_26880 [Cyanobacteria bacterium P01_B01_bin.77]
MTEHVTHLTRQSGLDPHAWDSSGNLLTFCGRWSHPLNNDRIQRKTCLRARDCTCQGCIRTQQFQALPHNRM